MGAQQQLFVGGVFVPAPEPVTVENRRPTPSDSAPAVWDFRLAEGAGRRLGVWPGEGATRAIAELAARAAAGADSSAIVLEVKPRNRAAVEADELDEWGLEVDRLRPRTRGECHAARRLVAGAAGHQLVVHHEVSPCSKSRSGEDDDDRFARRAELRKRLDRTPAEEVELAELDDTLPGGMRLFTLRPRGQAPRDAKREPLPPCPWVSCRYHLWGRWHRPDDVVELRTQRFEHLVHDRDPADWGETCALDVAEAVHAGEEPGRPGPKFEPLENGGHRWIDRERQGGRAEVDDHAVVGRRLGISREQVRLDEHAALTPEVASQLFTFAGRVGPTLAGRVAQRLVAAWSASGLSATELVERSGVSADVVELLAELAKLPRQATRARGTITVKVTGKAKIPAKSVLRCGSAEFRVFAAHQLGAGGHPVEVEATAAGSASNRPRGALLTFDDAPDGVRAKAVTSGLVGGLDDASMHGIPLSTEDLARLADALGLTVVELVATGTGRSACAGRGRAIVESLIRMSMVDVRDRVELEARLEPLLELDFEAELLAGKVVEVLWDHQGTEVFASVGELLSAVKAVLRGDGARSTPAQPVSLSLFRG